MKPEQHTPLTEQQEMILSRHFDGEATLLERFRVKRLIKKNPSAATFLSSLQTIHTQAISNAHTSEVTCDLWDRISNRIAAEERAAFYLGNRSPVKKPESGGFFATLIPSHALIGGISGAAIAAVLMVQLTPSNPLKNLPIINADIASPASGSHSFQPVTLAKETPAFTGQQNSRRMAPMEVDWMRGMGPLKIIQNHENSSGVIWVRRQRAPKTIASPLATPTLVKSAPQKGLDGSLRDRSE